MADTVIELLAVPGTTVVYMTSAGGSGTAAASYTPTQIAGYLHSITVPEALTGRWYVGAGHVDGFSGYRIISALTDSDDTFGLPDVPYVVTGGVGWVG